MWIRKSTFPHFHIKLRVEAYLLQHCTITLKNVLKCNFLLKPKNEIHSGDEAEASDDVVPLDVHVKGNHREEDEHHQGDDLLQDLELHQREGTTIALEANAVGRHLQAILEKGNTPRQCDHSNHRQGLKP